MRKTDLRRFCRIVSAILWFALFIPSALPAQANPFTSKSDSSSLSSVRIGKNNAELTQMQTVLRDVLAEFFYAWKTERSAKVLFSVLGIAFLYGILHA